MIMVMMHCQAITMAVDRITSCVIIAIGITTKLRLFVA